MPVADTSFLVAFFDRSDSRYPATRRRFADAETVRIPTEVLIETLGVLKAKAGREASRKALDTLMRIENAGWEETCDIMGVYRIHEGDPALSLVDAVVVHTCARLGESVLTYDATLAAHVTGPGSS